MEYPNIETERERIGLSKEKFAEMLGVSYKTYYNWINGVNPIPSDALSKMSQICNSNTDYLLGLSGDGRAKIIKNVRFDYISNSKIGYCCIEAGCRDIDDFKDALEFARQVGAMLPEPIVNKNQMADAITDVMADKLQ